MAVEYIVDIQGFTRSSNLFEVKELAIVPIEAIKLPTICLFGPSCSWSRLLQEEQRTNTWLIRNYHRIPWNAGKDSLQHHMRVIQDSLKNATKIYVKGFMKKQWLQTILPGKNNLDMTELCCPSLKMLIRKGIICHHHSHCHKAVCAVQDAFSLKKWLLERKNLLAAGEDVVDYIFHESIYFNIY